MTNKNKIEHYMNDLYVMNILYVMPHETPKIFADKTKISQKCLHK